VKKLFTVILFLLAMNFLLVAGGAGWLVKTGHLDHERLMAMKKIVFPPPEAPAADAVSALNATTQPSARLDELLAKASGRSGGEQVEFIQQTFDAQAAQLDRRERELGDLERQVDLAKEQMSRDRAKLEKDRKDLDAQRVQDTRLASDKGFQDSLQLYSSMPAKSVKAIFLSLSDEVVQQYLEAMAPRDAAKIIKEYKTPEELNRIQMVLERMRTASTNSAAAQTTAQAPTTP
jgi:flagellar motility protein MotE (MotC chaperone)